MTNKTYVDLDLSFEPHPVTGDVSMVYDKNSVIQSMTTLILAAETEFIGDPGLGAGINRMLFDLTDGLLVHKLTTKITDIITNNEKRVELVSVNITTIQNNKGYNAQVKFYMLNQATPVEATIKLNRMR